MKKSRKKAGRRLNHEGSVSERKDGIIQASKMVKGRDCTSIQETKRSVTAGLMS